MLKSSDSVRTVISYRTDIHALTVTQPQEKEKLVGREKKEKRSPGERRRICFGFLKTEENTYHFLLADPEKSLRQSESILPTGPAWHIQCIYL